ncbi:MAG: RNA-dependent DNA polymerase [Deltaproteobacteria bacterium]|nr:RNA-dependent DNA polymerase [Deltaproteobacteria bacterium]
MRRALLKLEEVACPLRLMDAARRAYKGGAEALAFVCDLDREAMALRRELLSGEYRPGAFRHFWVCDRKPRFISAAPFRDRVVHHSLTALMAPRLEQHADPHSYACRPGRGLHRALRYARGRCRAHPWALRLDVAHYFETIPHDPLKALTRRLFKGDAALALLDRFIDHAPEGCAPGRGLPIGNLTSQHLANLYLTPLDHALRRDPRVSAYLRYMDDLTLFGESKEALWGAHEEVSAHLAAWGLRLKPSATELCPTALGVPLLGFRVFPTHTRLTAPRLRRYRRRRRALDRAWRRWGDSERLRALSESLTAWVSTASTFEMRRRHARRLAGEGAGGA